MNQLFNFVKKEFLQVFRDRKTLLMLFGLPTAQIILFGFALTNEIKNSRIDIADYAKDAASQQITGKIEASGYFNVEKSLMSANEMESAFKEGRIKLAIVFPPNFNADLVHSNEAQMQVIADASDPNTANTLTNYVTAIVGNYNAQIMQPNSLPYQIVPEVRMLYNPELKSAPNFVPGVTAMVLLLVCVMMTSISIVKEKELGTMEILLVSPMKPIMVIAAKMIPYLVVSLINLIIILTLSVLVLEMPVQGSLLLLFAESTLFIIVGLALGLLISTITESQQSAMFASLLGMMLPTMLLSGYLFPIENMPVILQWISYIVPSRWYYSILKSIMLKGLGFTSIWKETIILAVTAIILLVISLRNFKIRLE